jgi:3-oxoacyl-[acyl-carrier-protein] synthase-1
VKSRPLRLLAPASIVGVGAQTPVGRTAPYAAAAVRARISCAEEHPHLVDLRYEPMVVAQARWLHDEHDETDCAERMWALAEPALREALEPLEQLPPRPLRLSVVLALPEPRPGLPADRLAWLAQRLREELAGAVPVEVVTAGHAAGLRSLELACRHLAEHRADACLVGGIDSSLCPETLNWLEAEGKLFTSRNPRGAIPGEAAAFCLVMTSDQIERVGLPSLAEVAVVATAEEPAPLGSRDPCIGEGLSQAFQSVLAKLSPEVQVDHVLCDLNGEPYRADELAFTLARTSERFVRPGAFRTPVDCWGDVGAASGVLLLMLAASAFQRGYAPGPLTLVSTSSGAHPLRAAAVLQAPASFLERSP